jgi:hypothetical protein
MNSNEKTFNYKVLNLVKYYNFGIGCISIRDMKNTKNGVSKYLNFKHIFHTHDDFKLKNWTISYM